MSNIPAPSTTQDDANDDSHSWAPNKRVCLNAIEIMENVGIDETKPLVDLVVRERSAKVSFLFILLTLSDLFFIKISISYSFKC